LPKGKDGWIAQILTLNSKFWSFTNIAKKHRISDQIYFAKNIYVLKHHKFNGKESTYPG